MYRLATAIILPTLTEWTENQKLISPEQMGFRKHMGAEDQIWCLMGGLAKNPATYITYLDLQAAYNSVPQEALWTMLKELNMPVNTREQIRLMYQAAKDKVYVDGYPMAEYKVFRGLMQGCCLSPTLFSIYLTCIMSSTLAKCPQEDRMR